MIPEPNANSSLIVWEIAVPSPLHRTFEYLPPTQGSGEPVAGGRVIVPFAGREVVGIFLESRPARIAETSKLKRILNKIDDAPLIQPDQIALLNWLSHYYLLPIGEALSLGFSAQERKGKQAWAPPKDHYQQVASAIDPEVALSRSPKQLAALNLIGNEIRAGAELERLGVSKATLRAIVKTPWVTKVSRPLLKPRSAITGPPLTDDQRRVTQSIALELNTFKTHLLEGVTGSGKTEVYIACIKAVIKSHRQALIIVPEIGLTPQTQERFQRALGLEVPVIHSGMPDGERARAWSEARSGSAPVVLGTRSSIFCSFKSLGLIIVDEEHDGSLRQKDHPRYSARDVAVKRAQINNCPVILGSATPSLESFANCLSGRYRHHQLKSRPGSASLPQVRLVDTRGLALTAGISDEALDAVKKTVARGEQALLFLNKRGFARSLQCEDCGWTPECTHCDAILAVHKNPPHLSCHHCLARHTTPNRCNACGSFRLSSKGVGTEQIEVMLNRQITEAPIFRIDSDNITNLTSLNVMLNNIRDTPSAVLLGTQMLSKGHDFPRVTCVIVVDADGLLFSPDFRAEERLLQLLVQVSGRSGRADLSGEVLIQTRSPDHPIMQQIADSSYSAMAEPLLARRQSLALPPHGALGLVRADSKNERDAIDFLTQLRTESGENDELRLLGPMPTLMTRRLGLFRYQIVVHSQSRRAVHQFLERALNIGSSLKLGRKLSWFVEIDPTETL